MLEDGLTKREGEVLALIGQGLSNAEIAGRLFIGQATVKTHVNRIFARTGSRDRAQAAAYATDPNRMKSAGRCKGYLLSLRPHSCSQE